MSLLSKLFRTIFSDTENNILFSRRDLEAEKEIYKEMFDNIDGKSLDDNQRTAVVDDSPRQLVVAGAGSGKTLTISAKVKYLVDAKGISPDDILLISFTKKAAAEMHDRIKKLGIEIDSSTFHKYGLSILTQVEHKQPDIADDINVFLENYLSEIIFKDEAKSKDFLSLVGLMMLPITSEESTKGEQIEIENLQDLKTLRELAYGSKNTTLRNEHVKSGEEVYLANRFFLDGIDYKYEAQYPYDEIDNYRKKYRPDFYIVKSDVYWEHFGINKHNRAPQLDAVHEKEYLNGIKWKRDIHTKNNTRLAETYSWQFSNNTIDDAINKNYKNFGITPKPVSYQKILSQIEENNRHSEFQSFKSLVTTFVSLFRAYGFNEDKFDDIEGIINKGAFIPKGYDLNWKKKCCLEFVHFVRTFYKYYIDQLKEDNLIDFNDMILKASKYIDEGLYSPTYKYIIIDEFQDISYSRYKLIKASLDASGAKLFCVGDDWQSIYRFSGSDIDLFVNFKNYFGSVSRTDITKTYRNSQELINISGRFILQNHYQLTKNLMSDKHLDCPIRLIYYTGSFQPVIGSNNGYYAKNIKEAFNLALQDIRGNIETAGTDILVLGRINNDINLITNDEAITIKQIAGDIHILHRDYPELNIIFRTIHSSKGLEADQVIVLNMLNGQHGFPSQIIDDPVISVLKQNQENFIYAEERRLFYVALTRTKNYTYLLAPEVNESIFVKELNKINHPNELSFITPLNNTDKAGYIKPVLQTCPICKTGLLTTRKTGNGKTFVSCSNYPKCDYALWDLNAAKNNIRCPECGDFLVQRKGKYGYFLGCSGYPGCTYTKKIEM